eukprot:18282-Heterococcus_DN1.PRE.4
MQIGTLDARELARAAKADHTAPAWSSTDAAKLLASAAQSGQLVCRIGSASANGVVYDIVFDQSALAALKFFATGPQAENEVAVATFLSDSVLAAQSTRFPIVYGSTTCCSVFLDLARPFAQEKRESHIKRQLLEVYCRSPSPQAFVSLQL